MAKPTVAIIGASTDRHKFGNKAVRAYLGEGYDVYPVNPHHETVEGLKAYPSLQDVPVDHLDRITVYVPPEIGIGLLEDIQRKGAREVWFNPGSDSPELVAHARRIGLDIVTACSLLNIGVDPAAITD